MWLNGKGFSKWFWQKKDFNCQQWIIREYPANHRTSAPANASKKKNSSLYLFSIHSYVQLSIPLSMHLYNQKQQLQISLRCRKERIFLPFFPFGHTSNSKDINKEESNSLEQKIYSWLTISEVFFFLHSKCTMRSCSKIDRRSANMLGTRTWSPRGFLRAIQMPRAQEALRKFSSSPNWLLFQPIKGMEISLGEEVISTGRRFYRERSRPIISPLKCF